MRRYLHNHHFVFTLHQVTRAVSVSPLAKPLRLRLVPRPFAALHRFHVISRDHIRRRWKKPRKHRYDDDDQRQQFTRPEWESARLRAWAWANGRADLLVEFDVILEPEP